MRLTRTCLSLLLLTTTGLTATACSDDEGDDPRRTERVPEARTSRVEGTLALASFAAPPTGVDAVDEAGARIHARLAPDGAFVLELPKDRVYKLLVIAQGEVPVVFPRAPQRLDRNFHVDDANLVVSLGVIRHFPRVPEGGVTLRTGAPTDPPPCVDGLVPGSTAACVEDVLRSPCAPGVAAEPDDEDDDDDRDDGHDDDRNDVGALRIGEEDADPAQPFALPDRNVPNEVDGCED